MKKPINEIERLKLIAGLINEINYNDSVYGVKRTTLTEGKKKKEVKELSIDVANPYEYRMGLQYELEQMDDYSNESLEKAKSIVLKNLAKDVNFYTTLLNQDQSPYKFEAPETDKPGMQAKADGYLKKELKKDAKANVQDTLGKKEAGKKKPKGVKVMPDKGVEGKEKVVKEGLEEASKDPHDKAKVMKVDGKFEVYTTQDGEIKTFDKEADAKAFADKYNSENVKEGLEEAKKNKYIAVDEDGDYQLDSDAIEAYLKSVIDPEEIESVDSFMNDDEGYGESSSYFFDVDDSVYKMPTEKEVEDWAKQEISYYLFSKPDEFPGKDMSENVKEGININENFKVGDKVVINKNLTRFDKEAHGFEVGDKGKIISIDKEKQRAVISKGRYQNFSIALKALDLAENVEEGSFMGGVDLGASFDKMKGQMNAEDEFNSLMSKYDWYYEMSDDPRAYDRGTAMNSKLKMLGKQIGVDKAIELFNSKAPSDRKITSSFFMEGEDKHSKIKEALKAALKKALKEEDPAMARIEKDEEAAEKALAQILTKKAAVLAKPGTQG